MAPPKIIVLVGNKITSIEVLENFDGRAWLVPSWIVSPDRKWMRPLRIIAPRFSPGHAPIPGIEVLQVFQSLQLTERLLEQGVIPPGLEQLVEVRENPDISVPYPTELH